MNARALGALAIALAAGAGCGGERAPRALAPGELAARVRIEPHPGAVLPLDARFVDEHGRELALGEIFDGTPAIVAFVYYRCPMLCTEVLNGLVRALKAVDLAPEEDYRLVAISIDPRETPELARDKEARYLLLYDADDDTAESGWRFLVGTQDSVDRATDAAGFRYVYDERSDQYAHASGVLVASGEGVLTHYFYGIEYAPRDLRLALVEASEGRIGTLVDAFLMMCFHYDPATGRYGFAIQSALRVAGVATVVVLAGAIARMRARERRAASSAARPPPHAEGVRP